MNGTQRRGMVRMHAYMHIMQYMPKGTYQAKATMNIVKNQVIKASVI